MLVALRKYNGGVLLLLLALFASGAAAGKTLTISSQKIYITKICDAIVTEALSKLGMKVSVLHLPTARAAFISNAGGADGEICRVKGFAKKYSNLIRINPSIMPAEASVFTKNLSLTIEPDNWEVLRPFKIGAHLGHLYSAKAMQNFPDITQLITDKQLLKMLVINRLDAAVLIRTDAIAVIKELDLQGIKMLQPAIAQYPLHFFLHKKNRHLVKPVSEAIQAIVESGRAAQIYDQYTQLLTID